ncbi:MAG: ATP-binding protein [Alphaproteobacteria bacterium]|nr:ATP-binding protein [Alphaproteobacteria bacterium]
MLEELNFNDLCPQENLSEIPFKTTEEIKSFDMDIGQERAVNAINFFMNVNAEGYNLFCLGAEGIGKQSLVLRMLKKKVLHKRTPLDWCYVNNFKISHKPKAISLPSGKAIPFSKDVEKAIQELLSLLPETFESDTYKNTLKKIEDRFKKEKAAYFSSLQSFAAGKKVSVLKTPSGVVVAPLSNGEVLTPEEFDTLPKEEQDLILNDLNETQEKLEEALLNVPEWDKKRKEKINTLKEKYTNHVLDKVFAPLLTHYKKLSPYLNDMKQDILENKDLFINPSKKENISSEEALLNRYKINVFVTHSEQRGAPIKVLDNPSNIQLFGRMEKMQRMGALMTDFTLLKAGALHEANGGFLILEAKDLLSQPLAWENLKRCLKSKKIYIENTSEENAPMMTTSLEPEPIPLEIKVVLTGSPLIYYTLSEQDPDFAELFKVEASFKSSFEKTTTYTKQYVNLLGSLGKDKGLNPLTKEAVAYLIRYSSRLAGENDRLTAHFSRLIDIIQEANYFAVLENKKLIDKAQLVQAIEAKELRSNLIKESLFDEIKKGILLIDTEGEKIGQINGLAVHDYGTFSFGRPSRITCQVSIGKGDVLDIEREVELGGSIHSKGVLILTSLLTSRFAQRNPLSLDANLAFEQSYGEIDGDSASCAEYYALCSAISKSPISQSFAVTGSVNQLGQIQAIGGVNEKIEGFFELCEQRGLTGKQGVFIPKTNVKNLILKSNVIDAVQKGLFHIYTGETVDDGIPLLFGMKAGIQDENGNWENETLNGLIHASLQKFFDRSQIINGQNSPRNRYLR